MNVQTALPGPTVGIRSGAKVDPWLIISQVLQGAVAVAQLSSPLAGTAGFFSKNSTSLKPLVTTTLDLIHHADRALRLLETDALRPLERPFRVGSCSIVLGGQDLREFNSILSGLCLKTSGAHSWATMLAQHAPQLAEQLSADVASLGNVPARVANLYGGSFTNRQAIDEALQVLGAYYDSMELLTQAGIE
ncbi:hypothetical protein [Kaistia adipata]|uniref:hypothetical protein n=1 Tax=Kaistia adipata TaxID=166954 RepID=UPI00048BB75F|nr:hypothetical protein [Kaistia adipata]